MPPGKHESSLMEKLLAKINYKGDKRICVLNAEQKFIKALSKKLPETGIDNTIDPRFLYGFIMIFVKSIEEVDYSAHKAIHNLYEDGILWYVYPKESKENDKNIPTRKKGWQACKNAGYEAVRQICLDKELSATRFRNKKFISRRNKE